MLKVLIFIFHHLEKVPVHRTGAFHYKKTLTIQFQISSHFCFALYLCLRLSLSTSGCVRLSTSLSQSVLQASLPVVVYSYHIRPSVQSRPTAQPEVNSRKEVTSTAKRHRRQPEAELLRMSLSRRLYFRSFVTVCAFVIIRKMSANEDRGTDFNDPSDE